MRHLLITALLIALPASLAAQEKALPGAVPVAKPQGPGAVSRNAPVNGVLTLFGNERCPTDNTGAEIVVCVRRSASEQFRIPKEMREFAVTPENESWANRVVADADVGETGIGSCSTVGAGGQSGCFLKQIANNRRTNQERAKDQRKLEAALDK